MRERRDEGRHASRAPDGNSPRKGTKWSLEWKTLVIAAGRQDLGDQGTQADGAMKASEVNTVVTHAEMEVVQQIKVTFEQLYTGQTEKVDITR